MHLSAVLQCCITGRELPRKHCVVRDVMDRCATHFRHFKCYHQRWVLLTCALDASRWSSFGAAATTTFGKAAASRSEVALCPEDTQAHMPGLVTGGPSVGGSREWAGLAQQRPSSQSRWLFHSNARVGVRGRGGFADGHLQDSFAVQRRDIVLRGPGRNGEAAGECPITEIRDRQSAQGCAGPEEGYGETEKRRVAMCKWH